jgi:S-adenosyl-L-methionine hydrolase (adenosine-forming)
VAGISLITDFGHRDWFVGAMKGVIGGINPRATVIDVTHEIPSGDVRAGAFALKVSYHYFPKGTIHVAIVDPGVGSKRQAIAVRTSNYFFVGPDNGVLSWVLGREKILEIRALENAKYFLHPVSKTFHGRDIFAPVAARLSQGVPLKNFGSLAKGFVKLPWPKPVSSADRIEGEIVYVDRFGNAITNIESNSRRDAVVFIKSRKVCRVGEFYQSVPPGKPVAIAGSSGLLEIAINGGNAAEKLGLRVGSAVVLKYQ